MKSSVEKIVLSFLFGYGLSGAIMCLIFLLSELGVSQNVSLLYSGLPLWGVLLIFVIWGTSGMFVFKEKIFK